MMKIHGVVVLYGDVSKVLDNIASYIENLNKLYVVDNTPDRDISDMFKDSKIEYIPLNKNKGISYALNIGAKKAQENGAEWLLTMDQDSCFEKDALKVLISHIEDIKKNGLTYDGRKISYEKLGIVSPFHKTKFSVASEKLITSPLVEMTSGNLVNLKAYKKVKGFNEDFFIDCVDFDFCFKVRDAGYEILEFEDSRLQHSLGDIKEYNIFGKMVYVTNHNYIRRYYITRNRMYLFDLHSKNYHEHCMTERHYSVMEFVKIWLFEKQKIKKTKAIIRGYLDHKKGIVGEYVEKNKKI